VPKKSHKERHDRGKGVKTSVLLETEEQMLEREKNERDVLEALDEYTCDAGKSVEDVPVIVNIKTLKGRLIAPKFNTGWALW
jgi:hypothetical protein